MDVLKDEQLEAIGLIKEVDTLKLIRVANEMKQRQKRKQLMILMGIVVVFCILAQVVVFKFVGFNREMMILGGVYVLMSSLVLLIIRYKEGGRI